MRNRITLIESVTTEYNPSTKRSEKVIKPFDTLPCSASPITQERQFRAFGKSDVANTVVRFNHAVPDYIEFAEMDGNKYSVVTINNYSFNSVMYLKEVSEW